MSFRIAFIAALCLSACPAMAAPSIAGKWVTAGKDSVVEIAPCGAKLCGNVAKLLKPVPGGASVDRNNPDATLRTRPLVGLPILIGFRDTGTVWSGTIYDPRHGRTYRSLLALNGDGSLNVQGCIAFFCQTQTWTKAQ